MYQIDNSTAAATLPVPSAPGTPGYFTKGNPAGGAPATIVDDDWLNEMMMEMVNTVLGAGLTPMKGNKTQLLTAIQQISAQAANNYWPDTGTTNSFVITPTPVITSLVDGEAFRFKALIANTGAATITINALSPISIVRNDGTTLQASDIPAGGIATIAYDAVNSRFLLQSVNASASQIQEQLGNGADDTGSANAYACTLAPALSAHVKYMPIRVKIAHTNTGPSTFNPGPGALSVVARDGTALTGGELQVGSVVEFFYDGTNYQYQSTLQPATNAEAQAGTDAIRVLTPSALFSIFVKSILANGYIKLPGGLLIQWGSVNITPGGSTTSNSVTFPTPFPNAVFSITCTADKRANAGWGPVVCVAENRTLSGFSFLADAANGSQNLQSGIHGNYIAIGN